jgi:hypothetical protein
MSARALHSSYGGSLPYYSMGGGSIKMSGPHGSRGKMFRPSMLDMCLMLLCLMLLCLMLEAVQQGLLP